MKHFVFFLFIVCVYMTELSIAEIPESPFHCGINLAGWFEDVNSFSHVDFTRFTREDFENIQILGCDHIRLPLELSSFMGPAPDYILDPLFFRHLDLVIGWAEDLGLCLILDNHNHDNNADFGRDLENWLIAIWTQIASRYRYHSEFLCYEILNEPNTISAGDWNLILEKVIHVIRSIDSNRLLIVGPVNSYSCNDLEDMSLIEDSRIVYTFHFYQPTIFTKICSDWGDRAAGEIADLPYPYDASRMPDLPEEYIGTWVGAEYYIYPAKGTDIYIQSLLDIAIRFGQEKMIPLWCSEFGTVMSATNTDERARWYKTVRSYLESHQIGWCLWEYHDKFGLFEAGSFKQFDTDINIPLIEALGLVSPPQSPFVLLPDSTGLTIYDDYIGEKITNSVELRTNSVNYYSEDDPRLGDFCISWINAPQYNVLDFTFSPIKDLSRLVCENYQLGFWIRGNDDSIKIDIRFMDTKTDDPEDHHWRMRFALDDQRVDWDGTWQYIHIPLTDFTEHGAWEDGEWFSPKGEFDWSRVEHFQIVAEYHPLTDKSLFFDDIRILNDSDLVTGIPLVFYQPETIRLYSVYPNPFNLQAIVSFSLPDIREVKINVYNVNGQLVQCLANERFRAGEHDLIINGENLSSGIYLVRLSVGDVNLSRRILLLK
jgi:endoglucanase